MLSFVPYRITESCSSDISEIGVVRLKPNFFPTSFSMADLNVAKWPLHGLIAPCNILFDLSGIMRSGSNSVFIPSPLHSSHAPKGELKENVRGSRSPRLMLQYGQALRWEYIVSFPSHDATTTPSLALRAAWTDSNNRPFSSVDGLSMSATASIVCFFCLSSRGRLGETLSSS